MSEPANKNMVISAVSALTAAGPDVEQSSIALQLGVAPFTEHSQLECEPQNPEENGLPMRLATVPFLPDSLGSSATAYSTRLQKLAAPALDELLFKSQLSRQAMQKTALFWASPERDASVPASQPMVAAIQEKAGLARLPLNISESGRTAAFTLLQQALSMLSKGAIQYAIIGGVDSWILDQRLQQLDHQWRLKSARNIDGLIPGEAAAFVLVEAQASAEQRGIKALAHIAGLGLAQEPKPFSGEQASSGKGLADAIRCAVQAENKAIDSIYSDHTGESYFAFEWGLMQSRVSKVFEPVQHTVFTNESFGDVGAASGALQMALAATQNSQAKHALLCSMSDNAQRAALMLSKL